jgi:hypothetical protein
VFRNFRCFAAERREMPGGLNLARHDSEANRPRRQRGSPGSSSFLRHERRRRHGRGYIDRFLIFRQTSEVRNEIGKRREEVHAFFQRLSRTFRRGDKRAELLQSPPESQQEKRAANRQRPADV